MSALGDYIHYRAKNYNLHGTTLNGTKDVYDFGVQKQKIINKLSYSGMTNKNKLEKSLQSILSNQDNSGNIQTEIQNEIMQILQDRFGESLGKINWETGNIKKNISAKRGKVETALKQVESEHSIELNSILARVNAIEKARDSIKNKMEKQELTNKINQIYKDLNMIITGKKTGIIGQLKEGKIRNQYISAENLGSGENNLITRINILLKTYASVPAINLQKGDLFEYMIALAPAVARVQLGESIEDVLNDFQKMTQRVQGGQRSKTIIDFDKNNFTEALDLNSLKMNNYHVSANKKTAISFGVSQDKVDVTIEWEGKDLAISAKNVNLGSSFGVHILSGSSFLYLIQDEPSDFINHYLNIIAIHPDGKVNADITGAHEAMKFTILYKALTGDTFGRDEKASVFIINDNLTGTVHVYEMKDLLLKAFENVNVFTKVEANGHDLNNLKIANKFNNNNYSARITEFIADLHKQKISAILKPNLFK